MVLCCYGYREVRKKSDNMEGNKEVQAMRVPLRTTIDENLLEFLKYKAIELKVDMNDIIETLTEMYKDNEVQITVIRKRGVK
jgi:hypothetical protein